MSVTELFGHEYKIKKWRLFTDHSKASLKAMPLHIGNKYPPVTLAYTTDLIETYVNMKILLNKIKYEIF